MNNQTKNNAIGGTCSKHGIDRQQKHIKLWPETPKERNYLEDQNVDGRSELVDLQETGWKGVDWKVLALHLSVTHRRMCVTVSLACGLVFGKKE